MASLALSYPLCLLLPTFFPAPLNYFKVNPRQYTHYCLDEIWQNVSEELSVKTNLDLDASLVAQRLKHLPAMQESWVRSLSWEDPLEEDMAAHSSILA